MMADVFSTIETLARGIQERFSVQTVYGEPITAGAITVVPVARVAFGFGGGGGGAGAGGGEAGQGGSGSGGGGGGGGGGMVQPVGYIEISDAGSRWVPLEPPRAQQLLRALTTAARLLPNAGRRGPLARLLIALAVLAFVAQLVAGDRSPLAGDVRA